MSYKKLEVWKLSREVSILVHKLSMELPYYELYETGSQIRRSSKSIRSNIVEGYGRRKYKQDFIRFLVYAHSSVDETRDHLETLFETKSLRDKDTFIKVSEMLDMLGKKLYLFIRSVKNNHDSNF